MLKDGGYDPSSEVEDRQIYAWIRGQDISLGDDKEARRRFNLRNVNHTNALSKTILDGMRSQTASANRLYRCVGIVYRSATWKHGMWLFLPSQSLPSLWLGTQTLVSGRNMLCKARSLSCSETVETIMQCDVARHQLRKAFASGSHTLIAGCTFAP